MCAGRPCRLYADDEGNLFRKIIEGKIPSTKVFETEHSVAILDAFPAAPGHCLLLPKESCRNSREGAAAAAAAASASAAAAAAR
eukprot:COSAG01_NODE_188_length_22632_cov_15.284915_12_plen_84_part_00